jgi:alpha-beta hydrolase superfamily lysophospholipase
MEASMSAITNQEGRFAAHGGLELYYQSWVSQEAPTRGVVLIVHGVGEHSSAYSNMVEQLAPAGFVLYGFDLRGHGRSPGQRAFIDSWDDYRQDLRAFVRFVQAQQPAQPLFLLGHSMGGIIVLDYALRHPEGLRGVVAIAPAIGQIGISPALMTIARVVSRVRPTFSMKSGIDATAISRDPQVVAAYKADPLVHDVGTARLAAELERTVAWIQAHAADLRVPLLIQHGQADRIAQPDGSRRFVANVTEPDKELHEYPGAFHQVHNDLGHEAAIADLLAWLEHHLSPVSGNQNP